MPETVFYAWQSDLPNNTNRGFIRDALERAIKQIHADIGIEDAVRADQDTQGVPGNPTITDTIFEKIDNCGIFLPDISIISPKRTKKRRTPNPNVMIEYGRATKSVGDKYIVPVFNEAFGDWKTDRPFDMQHKRKPITYTLPIEHTQDQRDAARNDLVNQLVAAISAVIRLGFSRESVSPKETDFENMRQRYLELQPLKEKGIRAIGFWCGLVPVSDSVAIVRPYLVSEFFKRQPYILGQFPNSNDFLSLSTIDILGEGKTEADQITPVRGGGERL